jgi:hypothetical protein
VKTVVIWDNGNDGLRFFVTEADMTGMQGVYINSTRTTDVEADRLNAVVYDRDGNYLPQMLDIFPTEVVREGAQVIVCGFIW